MMYAMYIMLTLCKVKQWFLWPMFPHHNTMGAQLAYLYIALSYHPRITPNGSHEKRRGYALNARAPPFAKERERH